MGKLIRKILMWYRTRKNMRLLSAVRSTFVVLQKVEESGLIWFNKKNRRLFIEEPMALMMMANANAWKNFMQNCFTWLYWRQCTEAWNKFILKEELNSVRRFRKKTAVLTKQDIERIRYARRQEIGQADMQPPKVEPFEFFIVNASLAEPDGAKNAMAGGEILCVGSYNPETESLEMAAWEDVAAKMKGGNG